MIYKRRELRRLWELEIYNGDPDDPDVTTRRETIIAFNQVDANRCASGRLAVQPVALFFVSWPEYDGGPIYRIDTTDDGPYGDPIKPSISSNIDDDWDDE